MEMLCILHSTQLINNYVELQHVLYSHSIPFEMNGCILIVIDIH